MLVQQNHALLMPLLLAALIATPLAAQEVGEVVVKRGQIADDLYVAGRSVDVSAQVQGDVVAAGRRVNIDQLISGDVIAAGESVTVRAEVLDDVRAAGRSVTIAGSVADHVVAAGETVDLTGAASIGGFAWFAGREVNVAGRIGAELRVAAQSVIISGEIGDDVQLMAEEIRVLDGARIRGNLTYRSNNEPVIADGAEIIGDVIARPMPYQEPEGERAVIIFTVLLAVAGIVYVLVFPTFSVAGALDLRASPLSALGVGIAFLLATPFIILLLFVTVIGLLVALPLLAWYLVSLLGGFLTAVISVGDVGLRLVGKAGAGRGLRVLSVLLALIALLLIQLIPALGGPVMLALLILGLGAFQLQAWRRYST